MIFRFSIILCFLFLLPQEVFTQNSIYEAGAESDDRLDEWYLLSDTDEEGILETKWKLRDNLDEWTYTLGDKSGDIMKKSDYEPVRWELRSNDGIVVQMSQSWRNDATEWKVECEGIQLKYEMPQKNDKGLWSTEDEDYGYYECITVYERDIRDWEIYDELSEEVSFEMKIAMFFISIIPNLPSN